MPTSVMEFLDVAQQSGVLGNRVVAACASRSNASDDATSLAKWLVKQGHLTAFQAKYLYGGKANALLVGPYTIVDMLGKGGMGYVYKAEHRKMRRVVALKVIARSALRSPEAVQRFEREVHAAARLDHPNIVAAHDAGEAGGLHYLVMQFVDGQNLSEVVQQRGPQPVRPAVGWILQAAQGLAYAHDQGVIHRDIKPGNLLIDREGMVRILDLGIARLESLDADQDQLTGTGQIMGTVDYMAPEQALDTRHADSRSDVYSLGATLWYLLAGRPMFSGATAMSKLLAHMHAPAPSLMEIRRDVPAVLERIFRRMVAKKPEARFQSMAELCLELEGQMDLSGEEISSAARTFVERDPAADSPTFQGLQTADHAVSMNTERSVAVEVDTAREIQPAVDPRPETRAVRTPRSNFSMIAVVAVAAACIVGIPTVLFWRASIRSVEPLVVPETAAILELEEAADRSHASTVETPAGEDERGSVVTAAPSAATPPGSLVGLRPVAAEIRVDSSPAIAADAPGAAVEALRTVDLGNLSEGIGGDENRLPVNDDIASSAMPGAVVGEGPPASKEDEAPALDPDAADQAAIVSQLEENIRSLATEHGEVLGNMQQIDQVIQPLRVQAVQLQQTLQEAEAVIAAKASQAAAFERLASRSGPGNADALRQRGEAIAAAAQLIRDVEGIKTALRPTLEEYREVERSLAGAVASWEACVRQLHALRVRWQTTLMPVKAYAKEKRDFLQDAWGGHADIPHLGVWLAWLHFYNGDADVARHVLGEVQQVLARAGMSVPSELYVDFVYVSLLVDPSKASSTRLLALRKAWPKHPSLRYFDALDALNKEKWSVAAKHFTDALRKEDMREDKGLNSDAAWFFASAPFDALRNQRLAEECLNRVFASEERGTFNAWRAKAALAAGARAWPEAVECIVTAVALAPQALEGELEAQLAAYELEQEYRLGAAAAP